MGTGCQVRTGHSIVGRGASDHEKDVRPSPCSSVEIGRERGRSVLPTFSRGQKQLDKALYGGGPSLIFWEWESAKHLAIPQILDVTPVP